MIVSSYFSKKSTMWNFFSLIRPSCLTTGEPFQTLAMNRGYYDIKPSIPKHFIKFIFYHLNKGSAVINCHCLKKIFSCKRKLQKNVLKSIKTYKIIYYISILKWVRSTRLIRMFNVLKNCDKNNKLRNKLEGKSVYIYKLSLEITGNKILKLCLFRNFISLINNRTESSTSNFHLKYKQQYNPDLKAVSRILKINEKYFSTYYHLLAYKTSPIKMKFVRQIKHFESFFAFQNLVFNTISNSSSLNLKAKSIL